MCARTHDLIRSGCSWRMRAVHFVYCMLVCLGLPVMLTRACTLCLCVCVISLLGAMHLRLHSVLCVCRTQFLKSVDFAMFAQVHALSPLFSRPGSLPSGGAAPEVGFQ